MLSLFLLLLPSSLFLSFHSLFLPCPHATPYDTSLYTLSLALALGTSPYLLPRGEPASLSPQLPSAAC